MSVISRLVDAAAREPHLAWHRALHRVLAAVPQTPRVRDLRYTWLCLYRAQYAYGLRKAAELAHALGKPGFTAVEFGVGAGNGLVMMEEHAAYYARRFDLTIAVVGFDTGTGLPPTTDHRDQPFRWAQGFYAMDEARLRHRLSTAQLVIGELSETLSQWEPTLPLGYVSFDLDYYTSTVVALTVLSRFAEPSYLPRVHCYLDDLDTIEFVGERLAVDEWNAAQVDRKLGQALGVRDKIAGYPAWSRGVFEAHLFRHPEYHVVTKSPSRRQFPLKV